MDKTKGRLYYNDIMNKLNIIKYDKYKNKKTKEEYKCPEKKYDLKNLLLTNDTLLIKRIGSTSENGEVIKTCISFKNNKLLDECKNDPDNILLVSKKIPLTPYDTQKEYEEYNKPYSKLLNNKSIWVELLCMKLTKEILLQKNICPNLPLYYKNYFCDNCKYESQTIKKYIKNNIYSKKCTIMLNEFADNGDLHNWLKSSERSYQDWFVMYFQIFAGLYVMQKFFNLEHYDLHWGNVLVHSIPTTQSHFIYNIDGIKYKIPNIGFLFTIWDFGYAIIPGKIKAQSNDYYKTYKKRGNYCDDYYRIISAIKWAFEEELQSYSSNKEKLNNLYTNVKKEYDKTQPLSKLFPIIFKEYIINTNENIIIDYSITNKTKKQLETSLPQNLKWLIYKSESNSESNSESVKKCKEGEELNKKTNRCRKKCSPYQVRNEKTGRCIKKSKLKKKCKEGEELNKKTNRCRKKCSPKQVRNEKTGRCIKKNK